MNLTQTKAFVKDLSKAKMSDKHLTKFIAYLHTLSTQQALPAEAKDHSLSGDCLVIYQIENETIKLVRLGVT